MNSVEELCKKHTLAELKKMYKKHLLETHPDKFNRQDHQDYRDFITPLENLRVAIVEKSKESDCPFDNVKYDELEFEVGYTNTIEENSGYAEFNPSHILTGSIGAQKYTSVVESGYIRPLETSMILYNVLPDTFGVDLAEAYAPLNNVPQYTPVAESVETLYLKTLNERKEV